MKKYMIRCDVEGVSGVVSYEQSEPGKSEFEFGKRMFMSDLLAAIDGLLAGGAEEIWIYDEHYYGRNIDMDALPKRVFCINGKPPYSAGWAGGLDESFEGLILLGFHSKRGTENALLNHTYEPDIADIHINGVSVGEIGMETAIAGVYGVPLLMITGDSEGVREAQKLVPGVCGVSVKESLSEFGAVCYAGEETKERIFEAARAIAENKPQVKPYVVGKAKVTFTLKAGTPYTKIYRELYGLDAKNESTIEAEDVLSAYAEYWARKRRCQKLMQGMEEI